MIELDFSLVLAVYVGLFIFGIIFNVVVTFAERRGWMEGYTSLAVVLGVLVTIGAVALISWQFALVTLGAFAFSGLPMVAGSIGRHVTARERSQRRMIEEVNE